MVASIFQVSPAAFACFAIELAHERDHVAQIPDAGLGQIAFPGAFGRPGGDLIDLGFEAADIGTTRVPDGGSQTNEISKERFRRGNLVLHDFPAAQFIFHELGPWPAEGRGRAGKRAQEVGREPDAVGQEFDLTVVMLDEGGAILDPVTTVIISPGPDLPNDGAVDVLRRERPRH